MIDTKEQSRIDLAETILEKRDEPMDLYALYDEVAKHHEEKSNAERLNAFFAELVTSAKFVYMGDNSWDLKRRQKIELWEKDGSFFNEYTEVEDAVMEERIAQQKASDAAHEQMLEDREHARVMAEKEEAEPVPRIVEEPEPEAIPEPEPVAPVEVEEAAPEETPIEDEKAPDDKKDKASTDDVDEEYKDFDEEKYNEYMDEFEDKYEK